MNKEILSLYNKNILDKINIFMKIKFNEYLK